LKLAVTVLVFCVAALLALGMVMLYSSSMAQVGARFPLMQLTMCALGLATCAAAVFLDYRLLKKVVWPLFILAVLLLILVLVRPFGIHKNGATRWLGYGKISLFQPSEFAKLALLAALAWYGERFQRQMPGWKRGVVIPGALIALMLGLIFLEPDVGNALLLAAVSGMLLLVAGTRLRYLLPPALAGIVAVGLFIYHNPMRSGRVYSWLHLEETKQNKGLQAYQAMVALGSGGVFGKGLGDSRQKFGFLPEDETDFILPIIGEELGLIATLLIIAAFIGIVICGITIAGNAPDTFGLLLGSGIVFMIGLQAFVNIGVVTSALPNKGLPLPFISRGGSSLLMMLTSVGVLISIARHARVSEGLLNGANERESDLAPRSRDNPFLARPKPAPSTVQRR
jgi:cell division protein FtsW